MDESSSSGIPDGENIPPSTLDPLLGILRDPLRRRTVRFCAPASDRPFEFDGLVDHLARGDGLTADSRTREEIAIDLHHRHLPKLAEAEVIEFAPKSGIIRYLGSELIEGWIQRIDSESTE
jgi:hypothetical protein